VRSATKVTAGLIAAARSLRVIARAGTGVDNVDVPAASARGIVVMNAPGANSISVAELAMGLALALARHLPAADAAMKQGKWEKKKFLGEELRDKTLGLLGLGRIGQEVARRAAGFSMRVIAHDPFISEQVASSIGVELVSMDDLFSRADYLSLHMPSTPQTKQLINAARLQKAKKGIRIINTARGDLIDEAALADAIEAGQVGGAGLDVFTKEPTVDHRLQMLPQVVATPHIAASTREGQELVGVETAAALRDFPQGRPDPQRGQLPVGVGGGIQEAAAFCHTGRAAGDVHRADERWPCALGRRPVLRRSRQKPHRHARQRGDGRHVQTDSVVRGHARQRAHGRRRARHRGRRVEQYAPP
jgi:D-3-phosphoglycerate dehydrogenase